MCGFSFLRVSHLRYVKIIVKPLRRFKQHYIIRDASITLYLITIRHDLDTITLVLHQTFELPPFKRDYDSSFGKVSDILKRYGIVESARNLRFRFILCMQEFFDSIPQDQWKTKDPAFIKESEEFSINKFREWIIEQIT
jgi:hypothetical protein